MANQEVLNMTLKTASIAIARLGLGWIFFWAFLDKTFGLGWSTPTERAWINGGSPTRGFLMSRSGWFESIYHSMADSVLVEWLFMLGLLGIGLALLLGIGMRVATISGVLLLVLMYLSGVPFVRDAGATNPFWDAHLIEASLLLVLYFVDAGKHFGLAAWWAETRWVQKYAWLA